MIKYEWHCIKKYIYILFRQLLLFYLNYFFIIVSYMTNYDKTKFDILQEHKGTKLFDD